MAEMTASELRSVLMDSLPKAGNTQSIAVGFADESSLLPLRLLLLDITGRSNQAAEERDKKNQKLNDATNFKTHKETIEALESLKKESKNQTKVLEKNLVDERKNFYEEAGSVLSEVANGSKKWFAFLIKAASIATDLVKDQLEYAERLGRVMQTTESAGIYVNNGLKTLEKGANAVGMEIGSFVETLRKNGPSIARLQASLGDGVGAFSKTLSNIDKNLILTNEEKASIFESVLNNLSPNQLLQMSQADLNVEVNRTAKEMKALAMATGKSVEMIAEENKRKSSTLRGQAWQRSHRQAYNILSQLGLTEDPEIMDYIMSGGAKMTPKVLMAMQNDPLWAATMPAIIRMANSNQLNAQSAGALFSRNRHLIGRKSGYGERMSNDPAMIMAAGASGLLEGMVFDSRLDEGASKLINIESQRKESERAATLGGEGGRAKWERALEELLDAKREQNKALNNWLITRAGGEDGVVKVAQILKDVFNGANVLFEKFESVLGNSFWTSLGLGLSLVIGQNLLKLVPGIIKAAADTIGGLLGFKGVPSVKGIGGGVKNFLGRTAGGIIGDLAVSTGTNMLQKGLYDLTENENDRKFIDIGASGLKYAGHGAALGLMLSKSHYGAAAGAVLGGIYGLGKEALNQFDSVDDAYESLKGSTPGKTIFKPILKTGENIGWWLGDKIYAASKWFSDEPTVESLNKKYGTSFINVLETDTATNSTPPELKIGTPTELQTLPPPDKETQEMTKRNFEEQLSMSKRQLETTEDVRDKLIDLNNLLLNNFTKLATQAEKEA